MREFSSHRIQEEKIKLEKYLRQNGFKITLGRDIVFKEAINAHGHFAAEDIVKRCKQNGHDKVSRATVYRALRELLEAGIIRKTAFGEKHQHFEHIYDERPHHHARCIRCYQILEFPDLKEDQIYKSFLKKQGFQILGHEMHFYGICKNCQKKKMMIAG